MSQKEKDLVQKIKDLEDDKLNARARITVAKRDALNAESDLIFASLSQENLIEELRVHLVSRVNNEPDHIEKDTIRLKQIMPELLRRLDIPPTLE
jgi:hypothetical protein